MPYNACKYTANALYGIFVFICNYLSTSIYIMLNLSSLSGTEKRHSTPVSSFVFWFRLKCFPAEYHKKALKS